MSFTHEIFKRSTLKEITSYLLYEASFEGEDKADYNSRLKRACQHCEDILSTYDNNKESILHNAVNQLMGETERVYMEIGIKAGFLLAMDIFNEAPDKGDLIQYNEMFDNVHDNTSKTMKD